MKVTGLETLRQATILPAVLLGSLLLSACSNQSEEDDSRANTRLTTRVNTDESASGELQAEQKADTLTPDIADNSCDQRGTQADQLALARKLAVQQYMPDRLACAAILFTQLASNSPDDMEMQVEVMTFLEEALFYLRVIQGLDLMGVDKVNSDRINAIGTSYHELANSAYAKAADDPRVMVHKGLAAKESDGAYDVSLLQQAIGARSETLNGLAQIRLGRMLFELPSILGGDFQAAIVLLEQAVEIDPLSMQAFYYLAEVYEQELEEDKAAAVMAKMLAVTPADSHLQMSTDMLRLAIGLSQRMGEVELAKKLMQKRQAILTSHPELMTRVSVAVGGHGGAHPITGD